MADSEFIPHRIKLTPVIFRVSGAVASFLFYSGTTIWSLGFSFKGLGNSGAYQSVIRSLYTFLNRK